MKGSKEVLLLLLFNFPTLLFGLDLKSDDELLHESYHLFVMGRDNSLSWDGLLLDKYINESLPEMANEACAVTSSNQCIRKWSGPGGDDFTFKTKFFPTVREAIFDRRLADLKENCSQPSGQLYTLGDGTSLKDFITFFSVRAKCGVYIIIAKTGDHPLYRIKLKDCKTGNSTLVKCRLLQSQLDGHGSHLTSPCLKPLENITLNFDSLSTSEWTNFKIVKREHSFTLVYVSGKRENILYKSSDSWDDFSIQYGHELNNSCWRFPDYEFLISTQNLTVLSPLIGQTKDLCLKLYVLMTTQKALKISVGYVPQAMSGNQLISQKIVYNEDPYKWVEIFIREKEAKFPLPLITFEPVPIDPSIYGYWGLDYLQQCHFNETQYLVVFDNGTRFRLPYENLALPKYHTYVYDGDYALATCSVDMISEYCVPFEWVSEEKLDEFAINKFRHQIDYACRCPNDTAPEAPRTRNTFWLPAVLSFVFIIVFGFITILICYCTRRVDSYISYLSLGSSTDEFPEDGIVGPAQFLAQDCFNCAGLRRRYRNRRRTTPPPETQAIPMRPLNPVSPSGEESEGEPEGDQRRAAVAALGTAGPSTSKTSPSKMVSDVIASVSKKERTQSDSESQELLEISNL